MYCASMNRCKTAELSDSEKWTEINEEVLYHRSDSEFDAKSDDEGSSEGEEPDTSSERI